MTHEELVQAVRRLSPREASYSVHFGHNPETGEEAHVICWHDTNIERPSDADILAEVGRIHEEVAATIEVPHG